MDLEIALSVVALLTIGLIVANTAYAEVFWRVTPPRRTEYWTIIFLGLPMIAMQRAGEFARSGTAQYFMIATVIIAISGASAGGCLWLTHFYPRAGAVASSTFLVLSFLFATLSGEKFPNHRLH